MESTVAAIKYSWSNVLCNPDRAFTYPSYWVAGEISEQLEGRLSHSSTPGTFSSSSSKPSPSVLYGQFTLFIIIWLHDIGLGQFTLFIILWRHDIGLSLVRQKNTELNSFSPPPSPLSSRMSTEHKNKIPPKNRVRNRDEVERRREWQKCKTREIWTSFYCCSLFPLLLVLFGRLSLRCHRQRVVCQALSVSGCPETRETLLPLVRQEEDGTIGGF